MHKTNKKIISMFDDLRSFIFRLITFKCFLVGLVLELGLAITGLQQGFFSASYSINESFF